MILPPNAVQVPGNPEPFKVSTIDSSETTVFRFFMENLDNYNFEGIAYYAMPLEAEM